MPTCAIIKHVGAQISLFERAATSERSDLIARRQLADALLQWWSRECASWDAQVTGNYNSGGDLWADMPTVDSKTVARMAPLFKAHTGHALDIRRIRRGGYDRIEDVIQDLVLEDRGSG